VLILQMDNEILQVVMVSQAVLPLADKRSQHRNRRFNRILIFHRLLLLLLLLLLMLMVQVVVVLLLLLLVVILMGDEKDEGWDFWWNFEGPCGTPLLLFSFFFNGFSLL